MRKVLGSSIGLGFLGAAGLTVSARYYFNGWVPFSLIVMIPTFLISWVLITSVLIINGWVNANKSLLDGIMQKTK